MRRSSKRYSNLRKIAESGLGAVYYGTERSRNRKVVVKKLLFERFNHPFNFQRFENEAAIFSSLYHNSIIRTYDFGESSESLYIAMEYINGPDFEKVLSYPDFNRDISLRVVLQALQGLHFAHGKGVVHGDVKPSNILISRSGQVKLSDFGLSQSAVHSMDLEGGRPDMTSLLYMPPERVVKQARLAFSRAENASIVPINDSEQTTLDQGIRGDMWSVGVLLFRVCSGNYPFSGENLAGLLNSIVAVRETNIRELVPDLPPYLAQVITACLEKEPYNRPASLDPVLGALQRYFAGESAGESETAIRKYIGMNIPAAVDIEDERHSSLFESLAQAVFQSHHTVGFSSTQTGERITAHEQKEIAPIEEEVPPNPFAPGQRISGGTGATSRPHSRLLPASFVIFLVLIIGMISFRFVNRDAGMAWEYTTRIPAATIVPDVQDPYLAPRTIATERTGITGLSSPAKAGAFAVAKKPTVRQPPKYGSGSQGGILKLTLNPDGARVFLNGKEEFGTELAAGVPLDTGGYEVVVEHPGYEPYRGTLQIENGGTQLVSVVLQPVIKGQGRLHVYSYPWADLYIDGTLVGVTPTSSLISLTVGEHTVLLKRDGFLSQERTIQVENNEVLRLQITLSKIGSPQASAGQ
jgi:serine/threonine protein kinase